MAQDRALASPDYHGAKVALICGDAVAAILRDDRSDIPFPAFWDLTGGGREGDEPAVTCALREAREELGLAVPPERILWRRFYPETMTERIPVWFFVAPITRVESSQVALGAEGQAWQMMPIRRFLTHPKSVPHLRDRLETFVIETGYAI